MSAVDPEAVRCTRTEYLRMFDAGAFADRRVELLDGRVIEMTPQDSRHAACVSAVDRVLQRVQGDAYLIRTQLPLTLADDSEPEPDIAVVRGQPEDFVHAHPDSAELVIEVALSSLENDRELKRRIYADAHVAEYWIVNLRDRQIEVFRAPVDGDYTRRETISNDGALAPSWVEARIAAREFLLTGCDD